MKLGLYTECFGNRSFEEMLSLSQSMGIKYLEIGTGNWSKPAHMDLNLFYPVQMPGMNIWEK